MSFVIHADQIAAVYQESTGILNQLTLELQGKAGDKERDKEHRTWKVELDRLATWAADYDVPTGKLDYSLRRAPHLRERVISLLQDLQEVHATPSPTESEGSDEDYTSSETYFHPDKDAAADAVIGQTGSDARRSRSTPTGSNVEPVSDSITRPTPYNYTTSRVRCLITMLFELGPSLENPAPLDDLDGLNDSIASEPDISHVFAKFPRAESAIKQRLGLANWERRLELIRLHTTVGHATLEAGLNPPSTRAQAAVRLSNYSSPRQGLRQTASPPPQELPSASASTIDYSTVSDPYRSKALTASTQLTRPSTYSVSPRPKTASSAVSNEATLQVPFPPAPNRELTGEPFQCPYCLFWLDEINEQSKWIEHVLSDLRPYVCTYPRCHYPHRTFADSQSWWDHEESSHRQKKSWTCRACSDRTSFGIIDAFEKHVQEHEIVFSTRMQLRSVAAMCEEHTRVDPSSHCPLCQVRLFEAAHVSSKTTPSAQKNRDHMVRDHIAAHLEQLALFVVISSKLQPILPDQMSVTSAFDRIPKRTPSVQDSAPAVSEMIKERMYPELPCVMMEERFQNQSFFGRKDVLEELDFALLPPKDSNSDGADRIEARHAVICGVPGVGKSELAVYFALTRKSRYDAMFWISADTQEKLEEDFSRISTALGLDDPIEKDKLSAQRNIAWGRRARHWLADPQKVEVLENGLTQIVPANWLIVFDNVDNPELLNDYWPLLGKSPHGSVLITTRDPVSRYMLAESAFEVKLEPFSDLAGAAYLKQLTMKRKDEGKNIAGQISHALGGLPLALSQAACIIREEMMGFDEFLERFNSSIKERAEVFAFEGAGPNKARRGPVAVIFATSQLKTPGARKLLEITSFMDADCVHEFILRSGIDLNIKGFPQNKSEFVKARAELLRASLFQRGEGEKDFSVHRLVQDAVQANMSDESLQATLLEAIAILRAAWGPSIVNEGKGVGYWGMRQPIYTHVLSIKKFVDNWDGQTDRLIDLSVASLLSESACYLTARGNVRATAYVLQSAITLVEKYKPGNTEELNRNEQILDLLSDLHYLIGTRAVETNRAADCMRHNGEFLKLRQGSGLRDIRLASALNEYGLALMMAKDYAQGMQYFRKSIEVYRGLDIYWSCIEILPIINLGQALWLCGDLPAASATLQEGLEMREAKYGRMDTESFRTGRLLHAMGNVRFDQGLVKNSEDWHAKALLQYSLCVGKSHHRYADVCHRNAQHAIRKGDLPAADALINDALEAWRLEEHSYQNEIARTTFLKAQVARGMGHDEEAEELTAQAVQIRAQLLGSKTTTGPLTEADFDELVTFWSR